MGLINLIGRTAFGFGGAKPSFGLMPPGGLHNTYSIDGNPAVEWNSTVPTNDVPRPSRLDERDVANVNKYRSRRGLKYYDNLPR